MKLYPHHIGDFNQATRHLNRIERSIYRDLIELYYDTEKSLPLDTSWICRRILATSNEESTVVERSLNEFFVQTPTGWWHGRCEAEIEKYRSNNSQRAMAGKASAAQRAAKKQQAMNGKPTSVEHPLNERSDSVERPNDDRSATNNHKPITNNQEPINTEESAGAETGSSETFRVSKQAAICVALKAEGIGSVNPAHPDLTALMAQGAEIGMFTEAAKAAIEKQKGTFAYVLGIVRGQMAQATAYKAVGTVTPLRTPPAESFAAQDERRKAQRYAEMTGQPIERGTIIDVDATEPRRIAP